ncbi:MAG: LysM repeat protein [Verrucomicrobiales bacterium]|jgi:LysM repeat protein
MMRTIQTFINSTIAVAGLATVTVATLPATASAQGDDMKYQVYSLQQSLRATNARVDQLEKELTRLRGEITSWSTKSKQQQVSYTGKQNQNRPTPSTQSGSVHHVASGDTLSSISRRYGIGLDRLVAANPGLDPHRIRIGQPIVIPKSGAGSPAKPAPAPAPSPSPSPASTGTYSVRSGDTLSSIARRHNTSAPHLLALNGLRNPNALSIGQKLNVPGGSSPAPVDNRYGSQGSSKPAPAPAPAEEASSDLLTAPDGHGYYEVVSQDTLYSIALSFGTTTRELRRLNKLEGDDELSVGQYLLVPVADESLYES